jgi:hypothetical protein
MKDNQNNILFALACILISFLCWCNSPRTEVKWKTKHTHHTDTVEVPSPPIIKHDVSYKWLPRPKDSIKVPQKDSALCDYVRFYTDSAGDSLVNILVTDSVQGVLKYRSIDYSYKIPQHKQIITNTDSIFVPTPVNKSHLYVTGHVGVNMVNYRPYNASIGIEYVYKNKWSIEPYFNVIGKSYNIKVGKVIF